MKTRPILFSAPMVRALLEGRKTQTRRIVKRTPLAWLDDGFTPEFVSNPENSFSPYGQPGDLLYVRENMKEDCAGSISFARYSADDALTKHEWWKPISYCPSIHMPRMYSRLTLKITGVRVERVQDIDNNDALAEGTPDLRTMENDWDLRDCYARLWNSINNNWNDNPWVWVIEFEVINKNVDEVLK